MRRLCPALAAIPLTAGPALAQEAPGDPAAGRGLAEAVCAACHAIPGVAPPIGVPGARPFAALAADPAVTGLTLHAYLRTLHPPTPTFVLNEEQLNDVIAYILSLRDE
jgi:mono/diheme cytochrome c family protein